ncbi:phage tail protein [Escherichia coli]|nr:phage tail protein [Escherichia coli]
MGADKTKSIMTLSSGVSQPLLADVQYFELYSSSALNRKLKNIVLPGFYCGFEPVPGTGLSVRITSENSEGKGAASVDVNNVQISVQQIEDVIVSVNAGATNIIVLEANFEHGVKTTQVDSASSVSAARIYARTDNTIGQNQIELCRVIVPSGATAVTKEMIVLKYRVNRAVGVEFSNEISSTEERKAATPLAVKTLHDLVDTKAPLDSPHLSGTPTSPTPEPGTNNTQIANAAFVYAAINALINGAPGTMDTLKEIAAAINNDPKFSETINNALALKAPLASPAFTGTPTAPTAAQGTNSTQIANTAFVKAAITALINGAPGTLDTLKEIAAAINNDPNFSTTINNALALKAPLASPAFTGTPTAPTASQGTNSTQIANTAFVKAAITALINGAPGTLDTLKEIAAAINNDPNFSTTINNALALKAPLASPALTGIPTAPTAAQGTNNTQIATTAYVRAAISALVGSSPEALDTLNELAAALGNDPNFATTMTNALAGKQPLDATLTALAALATGANKLPYFTGKDTVAQTDLTSVGRDILAKTSTLAVIQYLGLRELGTSGEKIPLLSTANTWSARQTFSAGITGTLTGNADTATKLKTARKINGVAFDGSADITLTPEDLGLTDIASQAGNAVQRSGDTMGGQLKIGTINALRIFNQAFGLIFRRSEEYLHLIPTNEGEGENGNIGPLRPFSINLRTGLVSIGNGVKVGGGITGDLTGNADTATKLKTARTIGGVSFDGSANIDLPGVNKTGNQSTTGNAATATKLQTARTIGGVSFDGSANINLPGVNIAGNQNTTGNAATATKLQTACTINGVSFDGSKNIELTAADLNLEQTVELAAGALQKNQNGADIPNKDKFTQTIGACRSFHGSISTGAGNWTTAQFIEWLESQWAFNHPYWMCKCSWSYGNNKIITDTGCGLIHLAGCVIEVMGNKGAMTIRVTTPSTSTGGGITNAQFTYINHGDAYAPGWRRDYNTKNLQPAFALGQTGNRVANDKAVGWNWNSGVYDADISGATTLILHFNMNVGSCPAVQFRVNYTNGGIFYRSARDGYGFEADWSEFYTTTRKPSAGDVGAYTKAECNSRFITGIRLGTKSSVQTWNGPGWGDKSGYVVTASINSNGDELIDTTQARPVQYCINGTWYNAGSI